MFLTNNSHEPHIIQLFEWLRNERKKALDGVIKKYPDNPLFYRELSIWFEQIEENISSLLPEKNVRRIIVSEDMNGDVVKIGYEYYPDGDSGIGEIAFRITTIVD